MILLLISIVLLATRETAGAQCPNGFEQHESSCYFFSHGEETWIGAFESCKLFGSVLVEVNSGAEDAFLRNKTSSLGDDSWWISLTDKQVEGEFVWETSKHILGADEYSNWASGEPNNANVENCVKLGHSKSFQWQDTECDGSQRYICEIEIDQVEVVG